MMDLESLPGLHVYPNSRVEADGTAYFLARGTQGKVLGVIGDAHGFDGGPGSPAGASARGRTRPQLFPLSASNAAELRRRLAWLRPQPLGLARSAGLGDRLGMATPGHLRAVRAVGGFAPILAQQSMRENARTHRTPQQVLDDAQWGAFQEGWRLPWGADADHLKTTADVDLCVAAGYTFFTVDPGDHVDNLAHTAGEEVLGAKLDILPWDELEDTADGMRTRYLGRAFLAEELPLTFDETALARAAAKYGRAIAHTKRMYRHLMRAVGSDRAGPGAGFSCPVELEVSVDETDTPTSPLEHYFIACELRRLGVRWVSLAPRYVGRFEKGVDYIGDLERFSAELAAHAAIARAVGPYKLSIHSGSDKFSIYPLFARHAGCLLHLKTAGTSYLEALRVLASVDSGLFREILDFARQRYEQDSATYHVSADVSRVPPSSALSDEQLPAVLDQFDGREVLHVTFGSALDRFAERLLCDLHVHEEAYSTALEVHFRRHLDLLTG